MYAMYHVNLGLLPFWKKSSTWYAIPVIFMFSSITEILLIAEILSDLYIILKKWSYLCKFDCTYLVGNFLEKAYHYDG